MSLIKLKPVRKHLLLRNLQILLIEPDSAVADVMTFMLESEGANVEIAAGAETALQAALQNRPDLMLCNIALPDGSGYSVVQKIRELGASQDGLQTRYQAIKAIAIAPCPLKIERQRAVEAGFQNFLFSPLEYSALIQSIIYLFALEPVKTIEV